MNIYNQQEEKVNQSGAKMPKINIELLRQAINMPWAVEYEICRILAYPYIRTMFALQGVTWRNNWHVWGMPIIQRFRGSHINIGDGAYLRSWRMTNPLTPNHPIVLATRASTAQINIGDNVGLTGTTIVAAERIDIGDRVQIGANSIITDSDFHPLDPDMRQIDMAAGLHDPVVIEKDVFIGMNVIILKGVSIGEGAVVGAGSVVSRDVPARMIVAGNPAKIIRHLETLN
jgi:acetyltransferase-like isoleucine patch superfamily enzyme